MTLDQYISAGASSAAFLAALATFLTVWQIAKQRQATYRPNIVVKRARVRTLKGKDGDDIVAPLLKWRRTEETEINDNQSHIMNDAYPLLLVNIGLGAATNVSVFWEFPMVSFVAATNLLAANCGYSERIEFKNGLLSIDKPQMTSIWRNQQQHHFDYLVPASIDKEPTELDLPHAYILAVAMRMSHFLRDFKNEEREAPQMPPLQLVLQFSDIAGKRHHMVYEIDFHWYMATPYAFEAELIPTRLS